MTSLSLSPRSFCALTLMWHFQDASFRPLCHRSVPMKWKESSLVLFCTQIPNLSNHFSCFDAPVEIVYVWPKPGISEMPVRSLQDGGKYEWEKWGKNISKGKKANWFWIYIYYSVFLPGILFWFFFLFFFLWQVLPQVVKCKDLFQNKPFYKRVNTQQSSANKQQFHYMCQC